MSRASWVCALGLVAVAVGCEKANEANKSGLVARTEAGLLADLPKGNVALFGGNYVQLQRDLMSSPLGKLMAVVDKVSPGLAAWQDCFLEVKGMAMVGGLRLVGGAPQMVFVMKGIDVNTVAACAKRAGFPAAVDADGSFVSMELPTIAGPAKGGYLRLPDGALLTHQGMPLPGGPLPVTDRAALEADAASLAHGTAADDTAIVAAMGQVDRDKAIWFVGSAAGTPLASKIGAVRGTFDLAHGLEIDVTVQITDSALADKIAAGVPQAKAQAHQAAPELAGIMDKLVFERTGDQIHAAIAIDNAQMTTLIDKVAPMLGGARPRQ